jgi:hypothetical protein
VQQLYSNCTAIASDCVVLHSVSYIDIRAHKHILDQGSHSFSLPYTFRLAWRKVRCEAHIIIGACAHTHLVSHHSPSFPLYNLLPPLAASSLTRSTARSCAAPWLASTSCFASAHPLGRIITPKQQQEQQRPRVAIPTVLTTTRRRRGGKL